MNYVKDLNNILRTDSSYLNQNQLNGFFYNKSVAIIGSAKYLEEHKQFEKVNQYDIVIRLNSVYKVEGEQGSDITQVIGDNTTYRTNVIYSNWNHTKEKGATNLQRLIKWQEKGIQLIIGVTPNNPYRLMNFKNQLDFYRRQFKNNPNFKFSLISNEIDVSLYNQIGSWSLTGVTAVTHILQMPIKKLYITGFDFYENDIVGYSGYSQDNIINEGGDHKIPAQKAFFMRILETYKIKIEIDQYLKTVLFYPLPNNLNCFDGLFILPYIGSFGINSFFVNRYIIRFMNKINYYLNIQNVTSSCDWKYICNYFKNGTNANLSVIICNEEDIGLSYLPNSHNTLKGKTHDSKNKKDIIIKKGNLFIIHPKLITKFNENYNITIFNFN